MADSAGLRNQSLLADLDRSTSSTHEDASWSERKFRRLVAIGPAADYLCVSRATVERLVFRGELPIVKVSGATRYDVVDLDNYVEINRRRNRKRRA
jgi:excisionase family DNA binding protein